MREKIMRLAKKISVESRTFTGINVNDPEYKILDIPPVTDEMAEVAMAMHVRRSMSAEEIAQKCKKPLEETKKLLWDLAMVGVIRISTKDGRDDYLLPIWVPGIMEMMVGNKELVEKYPIVAQCFEEYTRRRTAILVPNLPVGKGLMRVIPVEQSLDGEMHAASWEECSYYVENMSPISVSACSCRRVRRLMGEGCGHLEEDMCMQFGEGAEYYIRTGRGRQIDKAEAYDILKRAEENGLVHEIENTDGPGKTMAICNCCGCSCFSLRLAEYYRTPDACRSNFVSKVDPEKCVACGQCVETCNTNALKLGQKLCTVKPLPKEDYDKPGNTVWGKDKWDPDFRIHRKDVVDTGTAPCKTKCPAHISIQGYIKLASQGRYTEALELIKKENPFPAVCGRICPRSCESECTRGDIDDPLAIDDIKKFIAERDLNAETRFVPKMVNQLMKPFEQKVAVIGAGPAGLSCAFFLAQRGYPVTVFEKQEKLGGMMTLGIPSFRLEKDVVNAEIGILRDIGVSFKTGVEVGKDITIPQLREEGFKAFYVAIGAQGGRRLNVPGEDGEGVLSGIAFLREINLGKDVKLPGRVVVIGGGNVAIDVARTAVRCGADSTAMYCLESRKEMPALDEEVNEAMGEGITVNNSWGPRRILLEDGRITGVEFMKCTSVFDGQHHFSPQYDPDDTITVPCDFVLLSIGQSFEWGHLAEGTKLELNRNGTCKADPFTYQTAEPDIFTGGDVFSGARFVIDAVAAGKQGAESIHRFVQPGQSLVLGRDKREFKALDKDNMDFGGFDRMPRQRTACVDPSKSKETFHDLRGTFTEEQVHKETERCLGCGAVQVDEYMCVGCGVCTTRCKFDAIKMVRRTAEPGVPYEKLIVPTVASTAVKRAGRIAVKGVKSVVAPAKRHEEG